MSTLVEAMARALSVEAEADYYRWQSSWTRLALAALRAMREPTDGMLVAAEETVDTLLSLDEKHQSPSYKAWRAFIDAALQEHSTTPPRNAS